MRCIDASLVLAVTLADQTCTIFYSHSFTHLNWHQRTHTRYFSLILPPGALWIKCVSCNCWLYYKSTCPWLCNAYVFTSQKSLEKKRTQNNKLTEVLSHSIYFFQSLSLLFLMDQAKDDSYIHSVRGDVAFPFFATRFATSLFIVYTSLNYFRLGQLREKSSALATV